MAASIQDVAKLAGVAIGTVSRAFNDYPDIRPETKQRIVEAARTLGYTPNISARNLSAKKPPNIGLIVSGLLEGNSKDNLVYLILQGVLSYAKAKGLELALYTTDSKEQRKRSYTEFCAGHSISGTILSGITTDDAYFEELMNSGIPTVALDVPIHGSNVGWISIDNRAAAREAMAYLLSLGHRRILVVSGKKNAHVSEVRAQGVREALEAAGVVARECDLIHGDFSEELAYERVKARLRSSAGVPSAIFCFSDIMAMGAMRAVREAGLNIPGDVSVMGFDGLSLGELTVPPLTTVAQDMRAMGWEAARMLHGIMEHREKGGYTILPHQLLVRGTVCPAEAGENAVG